MKKKIIFGLLGVAIIAGAIGLSKFLISHKPIPKKDDKQHASMYVKTQQGISIETVSEMAYRGRVNAFDNVSLSSEVAGKILQGDVRFKAGENFKKGDVIVNIYSEDVKASLKSGKSSFLQTLSVILPDLKVDYGSEYNKWLSFFNAIDVEKDLPALPKINSDKEKVFLASNNVLTSYYSLRQQEISLTRYTITAQFDGSFKSVNKEVGAVASIGSELANIISTKVLEIATPVFMTDLQWIKVGDQVEMVDNYGETYQAKVSRISSFVEDQSVNVYLTYQADKASSILEGEYVDVLFKGASVTGFELPREAIFNSNNVYVLKDKKLVETEVEILRSLDDSYIISIADSSALIVTESLSYVSSNLDYLAR